jgi:cytochrome c2
MEYVSVTPSERMKELGWTGSVLNYIKGVTAAGIPVKSNSMWNENHPTFAQAYGGPLREDQVGNISAFVANWALAPYTGEDVIVAPVPGAGGAAKATAVPLTADQEAGKALFASTGCIGCHAIKGNKDAVGAVGPNLTKIWSDSEAIIKSDDYLKNVKDQPASKTAEEYVIQSIYYPNAYIFPKCPSGPCAGGIMLQTYKAQFDAKPDDFKKLLSYLSTLK